MMAKPIFSQWTWGWSSTILKWAILAVFLTACTAINIEGDNNHIDINKKLSTDIEDAPDRRIKSK
jgi:hypothetical protein